VVTRAALVAAALGAAACGQRETGGDSRDLKLEVPAPSGERFLAIEELPLAKQAWLVDIGPAAPVPDLVAHPPVFVGPLVVIAGSRVGYVALDRKTGAMAWRRPASSSLGNPVVDDDGSLLLVHDCEGDVAAAAGEVALACFDRVDPRDVAVRRAGVIHAADADLDGCATTGAWQVGRARDRLRLGRGTCAWDVVDGRATRGGGPEAPGEPDDDVVFDGWRRTTRDRQSYVSAHGPHLPGLTVLAAAGGDAVIRLDSSLRNDYLALDHRAWWPLPPPPEARSTPVAVGRSDHTVVVFFDGTRVAALTAP